MSDRFQSIEDLFGEDEGAAEETASARFSEKQKEIKRKEMERVTEARAQDVGVPYINLAGFPISPEALSKIPEADSKKLQAVCFYYDGEQLRVGATDVTDAVKQRLEELAKKHHVEGSLYLISAKSLEAAQALYATLPRPVKIERGVHVTADELNKYSEDFSSFKDLQKELERADVSQIVSMILAAAVKTRASDVHIESEKNDIKVRFRVDGVLHDAAVIPKETWPKVISRMKLLAQVKINVADKPQDGRFTIFMNNRSIDIRASFLPTAHGESVVMRLLDSSKENISFEDLGLVGRSFRRLKREIERPNGMIITTGPTGSGKTTTLYSVLKKLNTPETKIITIEDPVEYQLKGVNQSQVSDKYTFAKGLRSIVRQDPDIIMVGEIRDLETAEIAIQAALTGHLVLSTIHTNDASGTIPRFLSMGVKPYLLAPAINAMLGQRLVRRVCEACKTEVKPTEEQAKRIAEIMQNLPENVEEKDSWQSATFYKGEGCEACQGLGYKGRIGIYEVLTMSAELEKLIQAGAVSEFDVQKVAQQNGMVTMAQDGILKAMRGFTTVEEVLRVAE